MSADNVNSTRVRPENLFLDPSEVEADSVKEAQSGKDSKTRRDQAAFVELSNINSPSATRYYGFKLRRWGSKEEDWIIDRGLSRGESRKQTSEVEEKLEETTSEQAAPRYFSSLLVRLFIAALLS